MAILNKESLYEKLHRYLYCRKFFLNLDISSNHTTYISSNRDLNVIAYSRNANGYLLNALDQRKRVNKDKWLIYFEEKTTIEEIVDHELQNAPMDLDDDIILAVEETNQIILWEVYRIGPMSPIQYINIGHFDSLNDNLTVDLSPLPFFKVL